MSGSGHGTIVFDSSSYTGQSFYFPYLVKLNSAIETGIAGNDPQPGLTIYPNPSTGVFYIPIPRDQVKQIRLYNDSGDRMDVHYGSDMLDITALPDGMYFLSIQTKAGNILNKKLIKSP